MTDSIDGKCEQGEILQPTPEALKLFEALFGRANAESSVRVVRPPVVFDIHQYRGDYRLIPRRPSYGY